VDEVGRQVERAGRGLAINIIVYTVVCTVCRQCVQIVMQSTWTDKVRCEIESGTRVTRSCCVYACSVHVSWQSVDE
jgi:hypothetical protein